MPRFIGRNTSSTNYSLRAQAFGLARAYSVPPSSTFDFYVDDSEADEIRTQLQAASGVTFQEQDSTTQAKLAQLGAPAAKSTTAVHASVLATAANAYPGPITNPAVPRNVTATFAALWDGGDIVVTGTNQFGAAQTETITANPGATVVGTKVFATVTSIAKTAVGVAAAGASVGTGDKLGIMNNIQAGGILFIDGAVNAAAVFDATNDAVTPDTTLPNGTRVFQALVSV